MIAFAFGSTVKRAAGNSRRKTAAARATGICDTGNTIGCSASDARATVGPILAAKMAASANRPSRRRREIVPSYFNRDRRSFALGPLPGRIR